MSDRGPADEEDGDTASSSPRYHTNTQTHAQRNTTQAEICLKTNNISHSHLQTQQVNVTGVTTFPLQNGHRAQTNLPQMSPPPTKAHTQRHKETLLESFTFKYIFMENTTDRKGIVIVPFSGCSVSPMLPSGVVLS